MTTFSSLKPPGAVFRLLGVRSRHNQVRNLKTCNGAPIRASTKNVAAASKMERYKQFEAAVSTWASLVPPSAAAHRKTAANSDEMLVFLAVKRPFFQSSKPGAVGVIRNS
jgi:hypothetical protein